MTRLEDYQTSNPRSAKVLDSTRITSDTSKVEVRDILLAVDDEDFHFEVGQNIGVVVPGPHAMGNKHHFRLYSIADTFERADNHSPVINICVRRCNYIDEYSGEEFKGVASNYLCDLRPGDELQITGPYGMPWKIPDDKTANLILIGLGTGIAPFRAFIKHLYQNIGEWHGKVWLFHGAVSGLELLYRNDKRDDFTNYYDQDTFRAFNAFSPRPYANDPIALDHAFHERGEEIWQMMGDMKTQVYVSGHADVLDVLDRVFGVLAGSMEDWQNRKAEMVAGKRWVELMY